MSTLFTRYKVEVKDSSLLTTQLSFFIILLSLLSGCERPSIEQAEQAEKIVHGATIPSSEWLLVNYWATWCGPCRDEIPELNELHTQYKSGESQLAVVGVNYDSPAGEQAEKDINSMAIEFDTISLEQADKLGLTKPKSLPTTYLLQNLKIQAVLRGPQTVASIQSAMSSR